MSSTRLCQCRKDKPTNDSSHSLKGHYPKSGKRFLDFPAGEVSLGSSERTHTSSILGSSVMQRWGRFA